MKKFLVACLCALMFISCTANIEYIVLLDDGVHNKEIRFNNVSTIIIPDVEREGYDLVDIHDSNGKKYKSGDSVLINNNMTFTWEWTKLNKITLTCNGQKETQWLKPDTRFEIPKKSKDGYVLSSITDADGNTYKVGEIISPNKDLELTYNWEKLINKYTVTIISEGKVYSSESIDKGKIYTIPSIDNENFRLVSILDGSGFKYTPGSDLIINDNLTLIYNWEKISTKYTVSLINGETVENIEVAENEIFTIPEKINSGHIINTITDSFGNIYKPGQSIKIRTDLALTYSWTKLIDKCTITILSDGKVLSNQIASKGTPYKIPTPTKEGHTLVSIIDESGTKLTPGSEIEITGNLVLVYNWELKDCKITIISNNLKQEYIVSYGHPFTLPEKYLPGNNLVSITDFNSNSYTAGNTITVKDDMTITYNWAPVKQQYTVSTINDGTLTDTTVNRGDSFILEEKTKSGYRLKSISDNYGKTYTPCDAVVIIGDLAFTYNWQKVWNVTEIHNGKVLTTEVDDGSFYNTKLEKDGYELRSINGSNGVDYTHENIIQINSDLTLTYDWAKLHTVTILGYETPSQIMIANGKSLELNKNNPGYRLESITGSDGINYTDESSITVNGDFTLTYNWIKQYQVHYEGTTLPIEYIDEETTITIPDFENRGYYLDSITDENGKVLSAGTPIKITSDTTITWNWLLETPASDFEYIDDGEEVTITKLLNPETHDVIIPAYINNHPVTKLMGDVFQYKRIDSLIMPNSISYFAINRIPDEIKKIILSDSLTTIDNYDFEGRNQLQEIHLPKNLKKIGRQAFRGCENLTDITLPEGLTYIGKQAFANCTSLKSITIPSTVKTLGETAFNGCKNLININIPETIPYVDPYAFANCPGEWTIPDTIYLNWENVENGISIKSYTGKSTSLEIPEYIGNQKVVSISRFYSAISEIDTLILPKSLKTIEELAFMDNLRLKTLFLPNSVEYVGSQAFANTSCKLFIENGTNTENWNTNWNINKAPADIIYNSYKQDNFIAESINNDELRITRYLEKTPKAKCIIPNTIQGKTIVEIGDDVFLSRSDLKHITLPDSIRKIGKQAFSGCYNIQDLKLPSQLVYVGDYAFTGCNISHLKLPDKLKTIKDYAFIGCSSLKTIEFPASLKSIGEYAFSNNNSIEKVILNEGLINIGNGAFANTPNLQLAYLPNNLETVGNQLFGDSSPNIAIYVGENNNINNWDNSWNWNCKSGSLLKYKLVPNSNFIKAL